MNLTTKAILPKLLKYITVFFLTVCLVFFTWLYTSPRHIPFISNMVATKLAALMPENIILESSDILIGIESFYKPAVLIRQVKIRCESKGEVMMDEIKIHIDPLHYLINARRNLYNYSFSTPTITLNQTEQIVGQNKIQIDGINQYIKNHVDKFMHYNFDIENSSLLFQLDKDKTAKIDIHVLSIKPIKKDKDITFNLYSDLSINGKASTVDLSLHFYEDQLRLKGIVTNLSNLILEEFGIAFSPLENSQIEADIFFNSILKGAGNLEYMEFELNNIEGAIEKNAFFPIKIEPRMSYAKGYCTNNCREIEFEDIQLHTGAFSSELRLNYKDIENKKLLSGDIKIGRISVEDLERYWPTPLAPRTRDWIFSHISKGFVDNVNAKINLDISDIMVRKRLMPNSVVVTLDLENSSIKYMSSVPAIFDINAALSIVDDNVSFKIHNAKVLNSNILSAEGKVIDLAKKNSKLQVKVNVEGTAQDVIDLGFMHGEIADIPYKNVTGEAKSKVVVAMPIVDEDISLKDLDLSVNAELINVNVPKAYLDYDVNKANLVAKYDNQVVYIEGVALINNAVNVNLKLQQNLISAERNISIKTKINADAIPKLGFAKPDFLNNNVNLDISIQEGKKGSLQTINADLSLATILVDAFGIKKKLGEPGYMKIALVPQGNENLIKEYSVKIGDFQSSGSGTTSKDFSQVHNINSNKTILAKGVFGFSLKNQTNQKIINIVGDSFDLSKISLDLDLDEVGSNQTKEGVLSSNLRDFKLFTKVKKIYMKNGLKLDNPRLEVFCDAKLCRKINLTGKFNAQHYLAIDLNYPNLNVTSNDAGKTAQSLNITKKIEKGNLNIIGKYNEQHILNGNIGITDMNLVKTPMLIKLLSTTAILDGIINIFSEDKINFKTLDCPFNLSKSVLSIDRCEAHGDRISLTGSGQINFGKNTIAIKGAIASKNLISKVIDNIPIIGNVITGGGKESLLGADFQVQGKADDPEITANPLSILTFGIFRRVLNPNKED